MIDARPIPFRAPRSPQRRRGAGPLPHGLPFDLAWGRSRSVSSTRSRSCARNSQLAALRSRISRSLAVIIATDFRRSAVARSRHVPAVSLCFGALADALASKGSEWVSPLMGLHLLASGEIWLSITKRLADKNLATK